ncbi:MAG: hypothetical protein ACP5H2_05785 [Solirubrobacteraceae bacterium]
MHSRLRAGTATGLLALTTAAVLAVPGVATAAPLRNHGLTIASEPTPALAGQSVLIYGQLKGPDNGLQRVILYHRLAGQPRFTPVSTTRTNASGFYEFVRAPGVVRTNRQWFTLGPGYTHSATIQERVSALVTLNAAAATATTDQPFDFTGTVAPNHPHQRIVLQEQTGSFGNGWQTVATATTAGNSSFSFAFVFRSAGNYTLRARFPGDLRNIASVSTDVDLTVQQTQNASFTIAASAPTIIDGQPVTIGGTLYQPNSPTTVEPNIPVTLYGKTIGAGRYRAIAQGSTNTAGGYSFTQTPQSNMEYKAISDTTPAQSTAPLYVGVQDVVTIGASSTTPALGQRVTISGFVTPQHAGHALALQQQNANGIWYDVAIGRVNHRSAYFFTYTPVVMGAVNLRVQIGGGPVNVGADSQAVQLTVSALAPVASLPPASQSRR